MIYWLNDVSAPSGCIIFTFYTMTFLNVCFLIFYFYINSGVFLQMLMSRKLIHARRPVWRMTSWLEKHQSVSLNPNNPTTRFFSKLLINLQITFCSVRPHCSLSTTIWSESYSRPDRAVSSSLSTKFSLNTCF